MDRTIVVSKTVRGQRSEVMDRTIVVSKTARGQRSMVRGRGPDNSGE